MDEQTNGTVIQNLTTLVLQIVFLPTELQLKSEHKPIQHLNDWKRKIVGLLTDSDPSREDPQIFWRRDAILSIAEEKDVRHSALFWVNWGVITDRIRSVGEGNVFTRVCPQGGGSVYRGDVGI